jgi:hypothetical protein
MSFSNIKGKNKLLLLSTQKQHLEEREKKKTWFSAASTAMANTGVTDGFLWFTKHILIGVYVPIPHA